jgi:hypothetical protein
LEPSAVTTTAHAASEAFFPLDEQLQLWDAHFSETLAREAVWLMGLMPDDLVERVFERIGGLTLSDTSIWRRTQCWGEMIKVVADAEVAAAHALPKRETVIRGEARSEPPKGVGIDGVIINIRNEGYKELKVGCVFDVERPQPGADGEEEFAHAVNISYVGYLGGPKAFGNVIWAEASRRKWARALDTIALGDGAPWIWNVVQEHFGTSLQAIDYYHAMEHLYHVSHLVYGQGTPKAKRHGKYMENWLYQGHARSVANHTEALAERCTAEVGKALKTEAGYFRRYAERMQYMELREAGWPIGSGTVESGGKQFRGRFSGPGMRWSRSGAERMVPIRAAIMSRRFDEVWSQTYKLAPKLN